MNIFVGEFATTLWTLALMIDRLKYTRLEEEKNKIRNSLISTWTTYFTENMTTSSSRDVGNLRQANGTFFAGQRAIKVVRVGVSAFCFFFVFVFFPFFWGFCSFLTRFCSSTFCPIS